MRLVLILAATTIAASAGSARAEVSVTDAWARATPGASQNGAVYLTLSASGTPDRLLGVSTPAAGMSELHRTTNENGVMQMRPVGPLSLEPGRPVVLAPGGYHVMLMELRHPLVSGEQFPLTLTFEHATPVTVQVDVERAGATHHPAANEAKDGSGHQH
ncbi:MAG: copper chaperone PCu(A)C [Acetobacteraceae bacterium]|nr:copper chaperone PCu(A)C [Acetobacteraceae bacterium]